MRISSCNENSKHKAKVWIIYYFCRVEIQKKSKDNQLNKNRGTQSLPRIETNRSKQFNTGKSIADSAVGKDDIPSVITSEHDSEADENSSYTKVKRNSSKKKAKSKMF